MGPLGKVTPPMVILEGTVHLPLIPVTRAFILSAGNLFMTSLSALCSTDSTLFEPKRSSASLSGFVDGKSISARLVQCFHTMTDRF